VTKFIFGEVRYKSIHKKLLLSISIKVRDLSHTLRNRYTIFCPI